MHNRVNSVHFDHSGNMWIGTQNGLDEFDPNTRSFKTYYEQDGLAGNVVSCVLEDNSGQLWMGTNNGLSSFDPQARQFQSFSVADGISGPDLTGWGACFKSPSGEMFFGGFSGATAFYPGRIGNTSFVPQTVLTDFRLSGNTVPIDSKSPLKQSITYTDSITLSHQQDIFAIEFSTLSYFNAATNRYRYKLERLDKQWHEVGSDQRTASYTTLPAGIYTFYVQGATSRGDWSEPGVKLSITILPPWWATLWFRSLCVAAFLASLWGLYQFRLREIAHEFDVRLEERVSERTRIARELHDSLLQGVQGLMFRLEAVRNKLPGQPREAKEALDIAMESGEKAIQEGRDTVADLRLSVVGDSDIAQALTALGKELAAQSDIGATPCVRVLVEGNRRELDPVLRDEIYRIAREAVRNAFRHAKAKKIEAEITYGLSEFLLRVRDDGSGIDPEIANRGARAGHWGLPGMGERAKSFGGQLNVWSERGAGTEVQLTIPASIAYGKSSARPRLWFSRKMKLGER